MLIYNLVVQTLKMLNARAAQMRSLRKLLSKWAPRLLTVDQKRQRVVDSERCLDLFRRNKANFLHRYVTVDEAWIHHYTPEPKLSLAEWTAVSEKRPKQPKTQMWAGKVMASVFWDAHGVLFIDYTLKKVRRSIANITFAN